MKLTPPKKWVFYVSVALVVLGLLGFLIPVLPLIAAHPWPFVLVLAGYVLLFLGLVLKGF